MRTRVMLTSSLESVGAWRAQRLPLARFAPLALMLAWAACGDAAASARGFAAALLALSLVAQYRLWDDLVDRAVDRGAHPQRLLAACTQPGPFVHAVVVLAIGNTLALGLLRGWPSALGAALLSASLALWYRRHRARGLVHAHVLLLKYPALVVLLAPAPIGPSALAAALVVYAALCAFELLDAGFECTGAEPIVFAAHAFAIAAAPLMVRPGVAAIGIGSLCLALTAFARRVCRTPGPYPGTCPHQRALNAPLPLRERSRDARIPTCAREPGVSSLAPSPFP